MNKNQVSFLLTVAFNLTTLSTLYEHLSLYSPTQLSLPTFELDFTSQSVFANPMQDFWELFNTDQASSSHHNNQNCPITKHTNYKYDAHYAHQGMEYLHTLTQSTYFAGAALLDQAYFIGKYGYQSFNTLLQNAPFSYLDHTITHIIGSLLTYHAVEIPARLLFLFICRIVSEIIYRTGILACNLTGLNNQPMDTLYQAMIFMCWTPFRFWWVEKLTQLLKNVHHRLCHSENQEYTVIVGKILHKSGKDANMVDLFKRFSCRIKLGNVSIIRTTASNFAHFRTLFRKRSDLSSFLVAYNKPLSPSQQHTVIRRMKTLISEKRRTALMINDLFKKKNYTKKNRSRIRADIGSSLYFLCQPELKVTKESIKEVEQSIFFDTFNVPCDIFGRSGLAYSNISLKVTEDIKLFNNLRFRNDESISWVNIILALYKCFKYEQSLLLEIINQCQSWLTNEDTHKKIEHKAISPSEKHSNTHTHKLNANREKKKKQQHKNYKPLPGKFKKRQKTTHAHHDERTCAAQTHKQSSAHQAQSKKAHRKKPQKLTVHTTPPLKNTKETASVNNLAAQEKLLKTHVPTEMQQLDKSLARAAYAFIELYNRFIKRKNKLISAGSSHLFKVQIDIFQSNTNTDSTTRPIRSMRFDDHFSALTINDLLQKPPEHLNATNLKDIIQFNMYVYLQYRDCLLTHIENHCEQKKGTALYLLHEQARNEYSTINAKVSKNISYLSSLETCYNSIKKVFQSTSIPYRATIQHHPKTYRSSPTTVQTTSTKSRKSPSPTFTEEKMTQMKSVDRWLRFSNQVAEYFGETMDSGSFINVFYAMYGELVHKNTQTLLGTLIQLYHKTPNTALKDNLNSLFCSAELLNQLSNTITKQSSYSPQHSEHTLTVLNFLYEQNSINYHVNVRHLAQIESLWDHVNGLHQSTHWIENYSADKPQYAQKFSALLNQQVIRLSEEINSFNKNQQDNRLSQRIDSHMTILQRLLCLLQTIKKYAHLLPMSTHHSAHVRQRNDFAHGLFLFFLNDCFSDLLSLLADFNADSSYVLRTDERWASCFIQKSHPKTLHKVFETLCEYHAISAVKNTTTFKHHPFIQCVLYEFICPPQSCYEKIKDITKHTPEQQQCVALIKNNKHRLSQRRFKIFHQCFDLNEELSDSMRMRTSPTS